VRTIRNIQIHSMDRMQGFGVLKQVVHILTTRLYRVKFHAHCMHGVHYELSGFSVKGGWCMGVWLLVWVGGTCIERT
jgi:hypothetical protein